MNVRAAEQGGSNQPSARQAALADFAAAVASNKLASPVDVRKYLESVRACAKALLPRGAKSCFEPAQRAAEDLAVLDHAIGQSYRPIGEVTVGLRDRRIREAFQEVDPFLSRTLGFLNLQANVCGVDGLPRPDLVVQRISAALAPQVRG